MSGTNQQQEIDYASIMLQFNNDPDFIKLRDRYATKSFLEIMSTDRSETRHSSFLAWLLEGKDFPVKEQDHPIIHLLDILIRRESEQSTEKLVPDEIKNMVLSRNIKSIQIHEVSTEKLIKDLSPIQSIDRLDIYIHCTIELKNEQRKDIEFIIENKVGSKENGPKVSGSKDSGPKEKRDFPNKYSKYLEITQTERYYYACNDEAKDYRKSREKIFIYLTPMSNDDLSDFDNLGEDQKSKDGHFININYQDILDNIIEPLLSSEDISTRIHTLLNEYVLSLSLPALMEHEKENEQNIKGSIIMATRKVDIENITNIIKKNSYLSLIQDALKETIRKTNKTSDLLQSFGETYRKLFTAILRVYIETGNKRGDELDELQDLYYQLLGTPKDNTKFSITYANKENNIQSKGKRVFAIAMLKAYINYHKEQQNTKCEAICKEIHDKYFPNDKQQNKQYKLYIVLLENWYEKKEGEKYWYKRQGNEVPDNINIPSKIDSSRYEIFEPFLITNQWGLDTNAEKDSSFELLLKDICDLDLKKTLKGTRQKSDTLSYNIIDTLQNDWRDILTKADIEEIKIHINKK